MNFKKMGVVTISLFLVFGTVGCSQPVKQEEQQEEVKETMAEKKQEKVQKEQKEFVNEEVVEKFPELNIIKEYLYANYPLTEGVDKGKTISAGDVPIRFYYNCEASRDSIVVVLSFEESVTKKEMVEAMDYVAKNLEEVLPKEILVIIRTRVTYTNNGVFVEDMRKKREQIDTSFTVGYFEGIHWSIIDESGKQKSFNPAEVLELTVERAREYLKKAGVEEESFKNNEYSGADESGNYAYGILLEEDKETIELLLYRVDLETDLPEEEYVENVIEYFKTAAVFPYKGGDTKALTKFIEDNVAELVKVYREAETIEGIEGSLIMGRAAKRATIGEFSVSLYLDTDIILRISPIKEKN